MKILLVSTLKRKVDSQTTASRSRIIYELGKGLAQRGHAVSLLGTADSQIPGVKTIPVIEKGWAEFPPSENIYFRETAIPVKAVKRLVEIHQEFDIIHNHLFPEFITLLVGPELRRPLVTTIHIEASDVIDDVFGLFTSANLVTISQSQRKQFKKAKINTVVYNGVDTNFYTFKEKKGDYLLWLGRINGAKNPDGTYMDPKGVRWAIKLAESTGEKLILSGTVHDTAAFATDVKPHLNDQIQWKGPVTREASLTREEVVNLYQHAKAFLMTVNWEEPFGLVIAESMSCGTPVIGFDRGAVAELIVDGKTGFVVSPEKGVDGLKEALARIPEIIPKECREHVIQNFSVERMVDNYETVYKDIVARQTL